MSGTMSYDASRLKIEHSIEALKEAKHILETNQNEKYPAHYVQHPSYRQIITRCDELIKSERDSLATLDRLRGTGSGHQ